MAILSDLGCDIAQGYMISRPMPIERFADWFKAWQQSTSQRITVEAGAAAA
jgi:diguanylate cyclase